MELFLIWGLEGVKRKFEAFAHKEYNNEKFVNPKHIANCQKTGEDLFYRKVKSRTITLSSTNALFGHYRPEEHSDQIWVIEAPHAMGLVALARPVGRGTRAMARPPPPCGGPCGGPSPPHLPLSIAAYSSI